MALGAAIASFFGCVTMIPIGMLLILWSQKQLRKR